MRFNFLAPALLLALAVGSVHAQGQPTRGEQLLKYRKAVYQAIAWNFGPMGAMAQGKAEAPKAKVSVSMCIGCHGIHGYQATFPQIHRVPMISGQGSKYIVAALTHAPVLPADSTASQRAPPTAAALAELRRRFLEYGGDRPVLRSTATLACVGRRQAYFRDEFLSALEILHRGDLRPDQLFFMRPLPGHARYASPIAALYLCGAGTHPGGGVTGAPGFNAAHRILADLKRDRGLRKGLQA